MQYTDDPFSIFHLSRMHWFPVFFISHFAIFCHCKMICAIVWRYPSFIDKLVRWIRANEQKLVNCQHFSCGTISVRRSELPKRSEPRPQVTSLERPTPLKRCYNFLFRANFTPCFHTGGGNLEFRANRACFISI